MNGPSLTASLLVAVLAVLAVASTAGAACAWVLWESTIAPSGGRTWEVAGSHNLERDCSSVADLFNRATEAQMTKFNLTRAEAIAKGEKAEPEKAWTLRVCLPDTIDPRGPKGK
jgi:hypothetical protein